MMNNIKSTIKQSRHWWTRESTKTHRSGITRSGAWWKIVDSFPF